MVAQVEEEDLSEGWWPMPVPIGCVTALEHDETECVYPLVESKSWEEWEFLS